MLNSRIGTKDVASRKYTGLTFGKVLGFLVAKTKPDVGRRESLKSAVWITKLRAGEDTLRRE
jgi:hypothetical protein